MKRPTFKEFKEEIRIQEYLRGARLQAGDPMASPVPFSDEEIKQMWDKIQEEPPTGLYYLGEITRLTWTRAFLH